MKRNNIRQTSSYLFIFVLVIIGVNWLSNQFFFRLDFTADKRYTLSKATRDIIKHLPSTVTVTAYFTKDLPPDIMKVRQDIKEMLVEYYQISNGKVVFNFVDPADNPAQEQEAVQSGIQPAVINVREKDQVKQQKVYLGAIVRMNEETDVIPLIQPGAAMEYALSSSIKKVSVTNKPVVGLLQGNGEPSEDAMQQLMASMAVLYTIQPVNLTDSIYNLGTFPTLMLVDPRDTLRAGQLAHLERFLNEGGNLMVAVNGVRGDFNSMQGLVVENGLRGWLQTKGITLGKKFVIDAQCTNIGVTQQQGGFTFQSQIPFPYFPLLTQFADHPIVRGLESVVFQCPAPLSLKPVNNGSAEVLARTSGKSGLLEPPITFSIDKQWTDNDFRAPEQAVAAAITGKGSSGNWKLVVFSSGNFATNGTGREAQKVQPDNISLMSNAVDWLTDQTGLMDLRTKQVTSRPLDAVSESRKVFIKYLNFLLPLFLVIGYGIYRVQRNRNIRMRRMNAGMI
ncbi:MAG: Gldg family protein [Bacteroidetes bacterium]|nr:Gldg family protein [Bacteroidota bacterium]